MSLRAVAEFILHLEHFRNVDLIQQGLYFMKFQIFHESPDKIYYANPYHHESKDTDPGSNEKPKTTFHRLSDPYIAEDANSFCTKIFYVRYAEELIVLRDIVRFRTELDVQPEYLNTEFFLKTELYY
jgi:hypothetical protein